ncbi:fumarylacetoacetase [Streptacidiphilus sp. 4-A2]|nr:fumarylacetoacetase [Streptacidiphilus sp. 4-A2]
MSSTGSAAPSAGPCSPPRAPLRRGRLGRLPLPLRPQHPRLRADHRADPPAAAGAPGVRGQRLCDLQLRAAQGGLPPAVHPGPLLPLQCGQRRGDVLLRRRLRGPQGLRDRPGLGVAAPRRPHPRPAARGVRAQHRRRVLRRARGDGGHLPPAGPRRGRPGHRRRALRLELERPRTAGRPRVSWVPVPQGCGFTVDNLPYGVFEPRRGGSGSGPRVGVAVGEHVLDLAAMWAGTPLGADLATGSLNRFLRRGPGEWAYVRREVRRMLTTDDRRGHCERNLHPLAEVELRLPVEVADYVDFYASEAHATNLGRMFRPGSEPLLPNWRHLPVGYHGRAGTVVPSGTTVRRPEGQRAAGDFGPSRKLDIEAEVGFVVGAPSALGTKVGTGDFAGHVFGVVLVNDWSARDIQAWEYQPLGPFLGKSFATSVSPWVVPLATLEHARVPGPAQSPEPLPYLAEKQPWHLDLELEIRLNGHPVSRPPFRDTYWSPAQMLAHLTVNGASLRTGDLYASGTVSGRAADQRGSLIELSWNGAEPVRLPDGSSRAFLQDGDTVTISATAPGPDGSRIGFGEVTGTVSG